MAFNLLEWTKKRNQHPCPECEGSIPSSWVQYTSWCPKCQRLWRMKRNRWTWKYWWYHLTNEGRAIPTVNKQYKSKPRTTGMEQVKAHDPDAV